MFKTVAEAALHTARGHLIRWDALMSSARGALADTYTRLHKAAAQVDIPAAAELATLVQWAYEFDQLRQPEIVARLNGRRGVLRTPYRDIEFLNTPFVRRADDKPAFGFLATAGSTTFIVLRGTATGDDWRLHIQSLLGPLAYQPRGYSLSIRAPDTGKTNTALIQYL